MNRLQTDTCQIALHYINFCFYTWLQTSSAVALNNTRIGLNFVYGQFMHVAYNYHSSPVVSANALSAMWVTMPEAKDGMLASLVPDWSVPLLLGVKGHPGVLTVETG